MTTVNQEGWSWDDNQDWYTSGGDLDTKDIIIFTDSQAGIRAIHEPKNQPGQSLGWINDELALRSDRKVTTY